MLHFNQHDRWNRNLNFWTGVACLGIIAVISCYYHLKFDDNITGFFRIGSEFPHSPFLDLENAKIFVGEVGHDGQQFLTVAFDPFLQHSGTLGALDVPSYRYRRILYPLLGYALAGGNREFIPYAMVALNVLAAIGLVRVTALFFRRQKQEQGWVGPNWIPLMVLCIPGLWFCIVLSTAGLLAACMVIAALYYYKRKPILSTTLITLACLTRETSMLYWGALIIASSLDAHRQQLKSLVIGGIFPISWIAYTSIRTDLQKNADVALNNNFDIPFFGIIQKLQLALVNKIAPKIVYEWMSFGILLSVFICLFLLWACYRNHIPELRGVAISSFLTIGLFSVCSLVVLGYYLDYNRVFLIAYCLLLLSQTIAPRSSHLASLIPFLFALSGLSCLFYFALAS
ncbi:MAG: AZOBR_p60025 family cell surface glycopolymer formation protein [Synechococcus sp.]